MSPEQTTIPNDVDQCRALIERHLRQAAGSLGAQGSDTQPISYDSIALAEVIVAIEEESGITIPLDEHTASALRSVGSFAEFLCGLAEPRA